MTLSEQTLDATKGHPFERLRREWLDRTEWLVTNPKWTMVILGILGMLYRFRWLTLGPLVAGDQGWPTLARLKTYWPWPGFWDMTNGLGGINVAFNSFRYPHYFLYGLLAQFGLHWNVIERLTTYWPEAIFIPVASWWLARQIIGTSRWTLLVPLLFVANPYILEVGASEPPLVFGAALSCFTLGAFIITMRRRSVKWAVYTGLFMALVTSVDIRPAVVSTYLLAIYFIVVIIAEPKLRVVGNRLALGALAGLVFGLLQFTWILPTALYHGGVKLPISLRPDLNIIDYAHAITGVVAEWTGAQPAPIVGTTLNPVFLVMPLLAFAVLLRKRLSPELVWLGLVAIIFGFLAKTVTPPFGAVYQFLYKHLPSFNLFREGSKFLAPVALALAILVPVAIGALWQRRSHPFKSRPAKWVNQIAGPVALIVTIAIFAATSWSQFNGSLASTTIPIKEPSAFTQFTTAMSHDRNPGQVLWFGAPAFVTTDMTKHGYNLSSTTHPLDILTGNVNAQVAARSDPFQTFCNSFTQAFCYLNTTLFPYLVHQTNTTYIVSPKGSSLTKLSGGVSSGWLKSKISSMFGTPKVLGSGTTAIYLWHIPTRYSVVRNYPAVGEVYGGPWTLAQDLPLIRAFHLQVSFTSTFNEPFQPVAKGVLPSSIAIDPYVSNLGYRNLVAARYAITANSKASAITINDGGVSQTLPRLSTLPNSGGMSAYGPLSLSTGKQVISSTSVTLGPAIEWNALARHALLTPAIFADPSKAPNAQSYAATIAHPVGPWYELAVAFDQGWRIGGHFTSAYGGQLFNLFHLPQAPSHLVFTYSSYKFQLIGIAVALIALFGALFLVWGSRRWHWRDLGSEIRLADMQSDLLAPALGRIAVAMMALAALTQAYDFVGIPSRYPWTALGSNPYALPSIFLFLGSATALASIAYRMIRHLLGNRLRITVAERSSDRKRRGLIPYGLLAILVSSCSLLPSSTVSQNIALAQSAGAPSPHLIGSSIADAQLNFLAKDAEGCISNYTTALAQYPTLPSLYVGRSRCYSSADINSLNGVLNDAKRAHALDPTNANYLYSVGQAEIQAGQYQNAYQTYRELAQAPNVTPLLLRSVISFLITNAQDQYANQAYSIAAARFPNNPIVMLSHAQLLSLSGNEPAAVSTVERALQLAQSLRDRHIVGSVEQYACLFQLERHFYVQAKNICERALAIVANPSGIWDNLSAIAADTGNLPLAIADMKNALQTFIANVGPYAQPAGVDGFGIANLDIALGRYYLEYGDIGSAIQRFTLAKAAIPPTSPDALAAAETYLGAAVASRP
jgi:tetratricopeptide (TPR) repeat protein